MSQAKVREFHERFDLPRASEPPSTDDDVNWPRMMQRWRWHMDEMYEMYEAIIRHDLAELADAVIDAEYFGRGTLVELGIDGDPILDAVHVANMTKVKLPGVAKIAKPEGWQEPNITLLIEAQRK